MAELHIDEVEPSFSTDDYKDVRDARTGIWYRIWGAVPSVTNIIRMIHSITRACAPCGGGRIYRDGTDDEAEFSVSELVYVYKGAVVTMTASVNNVLSGGDGIYSVYAIPSSANVQVSAVGGGWPITPHVRLGQITLIDGTWDFSTGLVDFRHHGDLRAVAEYEGGKIEVETQTGNDTLTAAESRKAIVNTGAGAGIEITLPTAAAGLAFDFIVTAAQYLKVIANSGDTIRDAGSVSAAAGYMRAQTVGNVLRLLAVDATQWIVIGKQGTWTIDS